MTLEEEIEYDRRKMFERQTMFFNEEKKEDEKIKELNGESISDNSSKIQTSKSPISNTKQMIFQKAKFLSNKIKEHSNENIISGGSSFNSLVKQAIIGGALTAINPFIGIPALIVTRMSGKNSDHEKCKKLYSEFESNLQVVNSKLSDLNKKDDLTNEEKQEKYALVKMKGTLQGQMQRLSSRMLDN